MLGPEMRSTGEVMGISERFSMAFAKSQLAAGTVLPQAGNIFVSVADRHKPAAVELVEAAGRTRLLAFGHRAARPTRSKRPASRADDSRRSRKAIRTCSIYFADHDVALVVNTPSGKGARTDEGRIRAAAVQAGVPCVTTIEAATAAVKAIEVLREEEMQVQALQDRFANP